MLPSMDGLTVLEKMRWEGISTPVILVTALGELSDKITGLNQGADDYLVKPYDFQELLARIRCITRRPGNLEMSGDITFGDVATTPHKNSFSAVPRHWFYQNEKARFWSFFSETRARPFHVS